MSSFLRFPSEWTVPCCTPRAVHCMTLCKLVHQLHEPRFKIKLHCCQTAWIGNRIRSELMLTGLGRPMIQTTAADILGWAHFNAWVWPQMGSPGPILFLGAAADALGWAHRIHGCSCRWLWLGPLSFWELLSMTWDGPISMLRYGCRWLRLGPLFIWMLLPMC